jgi:mannose-6-phosphate isomerase-like protein (cupin superfamily)
MSTPASPFTITPGSGERLQIVDSVARVLAGQRETGGRAFIFIEESDPGSGPPLHRHAREDECFYILEGRYLFVMNGSEFVAERGAFVLAPSGSQHTFASIGPGPGKMLIVTIPSGPEPSTFEEAFRATDRACRSSPPTPEQIAGFFAPAGLVFEGPPIGR